MIKTIRPTLGTLYAIRAATALRDKLSGLHGMEASKIAEYARSLYEAHGDRAEAEAAQKAKQSTDKGDDDSAANWRAIRLAIREIRGAHQS